MKRSAPLSLMSWSTRSVIISGCLTRTWKRLKTPPDEPVRGSAIFRRLPPAGLASFERRSDRSSDPPAVQDEIQCRSTPDGIADALFGEARLGRAGELLLGRLAGAGGLGVFLTLRHEALKRSSGQLLVAGLGLAGGSLLRKSSHCEGREQRGKQHLLHRILLDCG